MAEPVAPNLDFASLPQRVDRKTGADLVTRFFFPVAARTLEVWPITWRLVNGRAACETTELFAVAQAKLDAAPTLRSTRRSVRIAASTEDAR
jgi:hypothetical protein